MASSSSNTNGTDNTDNTDSTVVATLRLLPEREGWRIGRVVTDPARRGEGLAAALIRAALARQNMREDDIKPGDGIFFNTGWGSLWMKNNDRYNGGEPGIGVEVANWVVQKDLAVTGADTWAVEVVPNPDKTLAFPVHGMLICQHGIVNHENMVFDDLIADRKYQFVYVFTPSPIKGATGSNGCPIAMT